MTATKLLNKRLVCFLCIYSLKQTWQFVTGAFQFSTSALMPPPFGTKFMNHS